MKKMLVVMLMLVMAPVGALAANKTREIMKVEVVQTNSEDIKYRNAGLIGAFQGVQTKNLVFSINAIVNGEHTKLECKEGHRGCTSMTPGTYDGEFDGKKSLWISFEQPLTHKLIRERWEPAGGW
jgi:hypothetical protein